MSKIPRNSFRNRILRAIDDIPWTEEEVAYWKRNIDTLLKECRALREVLPDYTDVELVKTAMTGIITKHSTAGWEYVINNAVGGLRV